MTLSSLLYVSHSTIPSTDAETVVQQIIAHAIANNADSGLTGALLFTGTHFAQVLEGEQASIDRLMGALRRDPRHDQLLIITQGAVEKRRFRNFLMAYNGPSQFVARHVTRLMNNPSPADHRRAADWLTELLHEFATNQGMKT